jgi:hypothetical protein
MAREELTPLRGRIRHAQFVTADLESKDDDSQKAGFTRPFMAGLYDGEAYTPFFDDDRRGYWAERSWREGGCISKLMLAILTSKHAGKYIFAHNAGKFDWLHLLPWLMHEGQRLGFRFRVIPVASAIQVLHVWRGHQRWSFIDSYKLIPTALEKAAKSFGLGGKVKHDLDLDERDARWVAYNEQDCVLL